ncbi:MAG: signal peptidase I [Dehalococcoidia bacterium]|nr:MAG: signal peptidase I [Dehalococcoidia bacterium]
MKALFREVIGTILLAVAVFLLLQATVQSSIVKGESMEDSFHDGQRLLVIKEGIAYAFQEPEIGDVIVFQPTNDNSQNEYIKRIIGRPGDTVEVDDGQVYVNDIPLNEPYIKQSPDYTVDPIEVPADKYFFLGDNRNRSSDSHNLSPERRWLAREDITGKAWLSIWPLGEWGLVPDYKPTE